MPARECADDGRTTMSDQSAAITPILVSTKEARRILGGMCCDKFWQEAARGAFGRRVGPRQKRYWFYQNLVAYADNLARQSQKKA
jgi:hypothetical protein